ncbi:hypothetical protein BDW02DRAFT_626890 [Decorospora gaudefroyi]|uniref:F-box domain-containing protein n=1 Tax=Decorospora gaudefroyi TaxID=184978 RepID=A0A6A5KW20_9PLEO|nr:hypothetical protein BDW02DRAFT_626890 [Decorospora gaudefroyi]
MYLSIKLPSTAIMVSAAEIPEGSIDKLPAELTNDVMGYLRPHDLTKLARASKRYREIAQPVLWHNIELHRQDAHHHDCFVLSTQKEVSRAYLDNELRDTWSYRSEDGTDSEFDQRNAQFGSVIHRLYNFTGKSQAWCRLASLVRHLCLTVTHKSPFQIWNIMLSLPNLHMIEVIGESSAHLLGPGAVRSLREPVANKIHSVRLRGYIPAAFVSIVCTASASSIVSLDLGVLEPPKVYIGNKEEQEYQKAQGYPLYFVPRGVLWYDASTCPAFTSLTHLLLCKPGPVLAPVGDDKKTRPDTEHEVREQKQWASLLRAISPTMAEIVLEHRSVYLDYHLRHRQISTHDKGYTRPDLGFRQVVLKSAFADGGPWPNLKGLTFCGMASKGPPFGSDDDDEPAEPLRNFTAKMLPGVQIKEKPSGSMLFYTRKGTVLNQHGADGLSPHLYPGDIPDFDSFAGRLYLATKNHVILGMIKRAVLVQRMNVAMALLEPSGS